ncbi:acyl carrier protein [Solihabitans fulvus]|uniref:Acyl carrier protein n=1 Tax=Solihabitans fulvus TaxID=1892852 RepID=A0A5B2WZJ2_9PSEU|nr:acyl carrier protein [Solihabitans fulvus]KAA2255367.1 acyl carrier protein [Solihabitans fulvus]
MTTAQNRHDEVNEAVKRLVVLESRLSIPPSEVADDEPLNGNVLRVNSLGFLGMLVRLEDELDVTLPDDLFAGTVFTTVADLVGVVLRAVEVPR